MIIDWFNSGIGKVHIVLDYSITIWTLLQFAELLLSDITIRLYYHYVCIVYLFKKSMNDVRWIVKFIMVEGVGGYLSILIFLLLGERGLKLGCSRTARSAGGLRPPHFVYSCSNSSFLNLSNLILAPFRLLGVLSKYSSIKGADNLHIVPFLPSPYRE